MSTSCSISQRKGSYEARQLPHLAYNILGILEIGSYIRCIKPRKINPLGTELNEPAVMNIMDIEY